MKYTRVVSRVSTVILASLLLFASGCTRSAILPTTTDSIPSKIDQPISVQIDGSQGFQTIDGFGVNINGAAWNDGKIIPALDLLSDTMGCNIFRVILETADWESTNDNADPQTFNWGYYNPIYKSAKFQSLWNMIRYLEKNPKNTIILNIMGWTPDWMGNRVINTSAEDEWVEMIASVVYYARKVEHLDIKLLSPANETDFGYPEGPGIGPEQFTRLLKKLVLRFQALGMGDIQLAAPDTADVQKASEYIEHIAADPVVQEKIAHLSFHNYGGDSGPAQSLANDVTPGRGYWMTEFSQWCQGCDSGGSVSNQWSFATDTVDYLFNYLKQGATAAVTYDGIDTFYVHHRAFGYWGVIAYDGQAKSYLPRKRFYAGAQIFRFVYPGMLRLQASSDNEWVNVLAFTDPKTSTMTIVGHNPTASSIILKGILNNARMTGALSLYQTTQSTDLEHSADIPIAANTFSAQIAPDSIFTLTTAKNR